MVSTDPLRVGAGINIIVYSKNKQRGSMCYNIVAHGTGSLARLSCIYTQEQGYHAYNYSKPCDLNH